MMSMLCLLQIVDRVSRFAAEEMIDHIGINKMFRRYLQNVRLTSGASDHHLLTARLKLQIRGH